MGIEELINEKINDWDDCLNRHYGGETQNSDVLIRAALSDMEQLKTSLPTQQDKVVVPEYIKNTMEQYDSLQEMLTEEYYSNSTDEIDNDKVQCWIDDNFDLLCRAWLDMPNTKEVVVPELVGKYIDYARQCLDLNILTVANYQNIKSNMGKLGADEISQWAHKNPDDFIKAYQTGDYTVEKEPLYVVAMPFVGFLTDSYDNPTTRCKKDAARSTEKEIKSLSLDYWAFAVPVEEESQ